MNILLNKKQNLNKFLYTILEDTKSNINLNNLTICDNILKIKKKNIIGFTNQSNLQYSTKLNINNYLCFFKQSKDISIITFKTTDNIYKLYSKHFFNFLIKNKIQLIKGRILALQKDLDKWVFLIGVNGNILFVFKKSINLGYQIKKKNIEKYFLKKTRFFFKDIIKNRNLLKVNISRKKNLKNNINILK